MNRVKFVLNTLLAPGYFMLVLIMGIMDAFCAAYRETADGIRETKRMYWDNPKG